MATLRVKVDPTGAVTGAQTAENAIEGVTRSAHRMEASTTSATKSIGLMGRGMGGAAGGARGLAMQLSQVTDMGLATGQWSRALFIQASDIAMLFGGPLTIALGAAIGVLGMLGTSFLTAGDGAKSLDETIDELTQSVRDYRDATRDMGASLDDLTARFGGNVEAGRRVLEIQQQLAQARAQRAFQTTIGGIADVFGGSDPASVIEGQLAALSQLEQKAEDLRNQIAYATGDVTGLNRELMRVEEHIVPFQDLDRTIRDLQDGFNLSRQQAEELAIAAARISEAGTVEDQVVAAQNLADMIYQATNGLREADEETFALYQSLLDAVTAGLEFEGINFSAPIASAADEAARLEANLRNAYGLYAFTRERAPDEPVVRAPRTRRGGGGRSRSAVVDLAEEYERLRASLDPVFRATQQFEASQTLLNNALAQGQITQAQYNETLAMARAEYEEVIAAQQEFEFNFSSIQSSMENAFMSMIDGTMSAKDAFRSMARDIIAELYRVLVVQQLVGQFDAASGSGSGLMGLFGGLFGMRAEGGNVQAGEAYLVGERGPEVFRPAANGQIERGSQGGVVVHQTFTFQANGDASVKQIIRQAMPEIAEASKAAVMDARQRGGSFAGVFR